MRVLLIILAMFFNLFGMARDGDRIDSRTVGTFDVDKYMGRWYEIARLNHPMERGLVGVTATYSKLGDGQVRVLNRGYDTSRDNKVRSIEGRARIVDSSDPGKFRVTFFLVATSDYFILELDRKGYSYALIGNGSPNYLWILSRTPQIPRSVLNHLLECARARGYDVSDLIYVDQRNNMERLSKVDD